MIHIANPLPCHPDALKLAGLAFEGNIIPLSWLHHIRFDSGQPDLNAIMLLADIVYWYRPVAVRDEASGTLIGYRQKFHHDLLRKSYQQYADLFGLSKRQVTDAIVRLEKLGLVQRVFRTLQTEVAACANILFIALHADEVIRITTSSRKSAYGHSEPSGSTFTIVPTVHAQRADSQPEEAQPATVDATSRVMPAPTPPLSQSPSGSTLNGAPSALSKGQVSSVNGIGIPLQRDTSIDKEITAQTSAFSPQAVVQQPSQSRSGPWPEREVVKTLVDMWNTTLNDPTVTVIAAHHPRLRSLFASTFNNDLTQWQAFCTRVAKTPFLRGHGPNGWKADLKWCLSPLNLQSILQGRYDRCLGYRSAPTTTATVSDEQAKQAELLMHIDAITDPLTQRFQRALMAVVPLFQHYNWLKELRIDRVQEGTVSISAPTKFMRDHCQQRHETVILATLTQLIPELQRVEWIVNAQSHPPPRQQFEEAVPCFDRLKTASSMPNHPKEGRAS